MSVLTGEEFGKIIIYQGSAAAIDKLKNICGDRISKLSFGYLQKKGCPDAFYCHKEVEQLTWKTMLLDAEKYRQGNKDQEYTNPAGYAYRISKTFCIKDILKHIQLRDRENYFIDDPNTPDLADHRQPLIFPFDTEIESKYYKKELLAMIRREIYDLSGPQLTAFEMYLNGFMHKEIAFFLDITPDLSKTWISRIIRKIKIKMKKY